MLRNKNGLARKQVTTDDLALPYDDLEGPHQPNVTWGDCVVRVHETELLRLPQILRSISSEEYTR